MESGVKVILDDLKEDIDRIKILTPFNDYLGFLQENEKLSKSEELLNLNI
ncbi:hypothetical protein [Clostridium neonatale]|nr:hypothetical protein [Clostridium neonatale]CAI3721617.1 hypothetical protein CNEO4_830029 [Clostridium neonatale]CAI3724850.1 hypothetical protein CNEO4_860024 [Clostridium neonatale]